MKKEVCLIYITASGYEEAKKIGKALVEKRLCACVNVYPKVTSFYWWEEKLNEDEEAVIVAKTRKEFVERVKEEVLRIHSYSCPCILALPVEGGHEEFIEWIVKETAA